MLAVIAIVVIVISILLPALTKGRSAARVAICASNEHSIYQAYQNFRNDGAVSKGRLNQMVASGWPLTLHAYFGEEASVTTCPEDTEGSEPSDAGFSGAFIAHKGSSFPAGINGTYDMQDGPLHRKLSQTQYNELIALYGTGDGGWWPYFADGGEYAQDGGYQDDGQNVLYLVIEDIIGPGGQPSGDKDFNDVQIKIEHEADGTTLISARKASGNRFWLTHGDGNELLFEDQNGGELGWNWYGPTVITQGVASYGMNPHVDSLPGGKIMLIDYEKSSANPNTDNWNWYRDDADGDNLTFARHPNRMINVLTRDGAVNQADPETLDPNFSQVRNERWLP